MAIVRMSEFYGYVLNEDLPAVLDGLQAFNAITLKDIAAQAQAPFAAGKTDYDFERNRYQQEHIQHVLKSMERFEKQQRKTKKSLKQSFQVMHMSYETLQQRSKSIDIEYLLETYGEDYDTKASAIENFKVSKPWVHSRMELDKLIELSQSRAIIGTVSSANASPFMKELSRYRMVYAMETPIEDGIIVVIRCLESDRGALEILCEQYDVEARSAKSLQIIDAHKTMDRILNDLISKRKGMDDRYESMGYYQEELKIYYEYLRQEEFRYQKVSQFLQSQHVTILAGWVESEEAEELEQVLAKATNGVFHFSAEACDLSERDVPIKLRNKRLFRPFELITNMYSKPRYNELDPTPLLTVFYAVFFGMMLADIGYGLLMAVGCFLALKLIQMKQSTRQMISFLLILSVPTILWGIIYGSFFGGLIPMRGLLDIQRDFNLVMVISLAFGVLHLFFGLALKGYLYFIRKEYAAILYDVVFWYLALIGAIILISMMFTDLLKAWQGIGLVLMVIGMAGIVLTNGRSAKTIPGKAASGLYSLYGITNYVGDIVSYTRLMALGLAGASIGMAFNMIVTMLSALGWYGVLFGAAVFAIGHGFNVFISGLSAYVHSARLTYVEFFGKFYQGGGAPFTNFRAASTYIEIGDKT